MALLTSEVDRIRYELGYNVLDAGAEYYIGVTAVFDQVITTYLRSGATTTSTTTVTAASAPTPVTITLASGTGFTTGDTVVIDVDSRQERVTAQLVSGASLTAMLSLAHTGTYAVTVERGESIVREILGRLRGIADQIAESSSTGGIKRVDEIEFFGASGDSDRLTGLRRHVAYWRDELASALGVPNMHNQRRGSGRMLTLY